MWVLGLLVGFVLLGGVPCLVACVKTWVHRRWIEPVDEWLVSLDGQDVAVVSDGRYDDMFWSRYRVTPLHPGFLPKLMDATLWNECRFRFRHRVSGRVVSSFSGGGRPPDETDEGLRVTLRWFTPVRA